MNGDRPDSDLRKWLDNKEARKILKKAASEILHKMKCRSFSSTPPLSCDEIENELVLFLLSNRSIYQKIGFSSRFQSYLVQAFLNRWMEGMRQKHLDPFRYLYKRAAAVLRKSESFFTQASRSGTSFSMRETNFRLARMAGEDIRSISFPEMKMPVVDIKKIAGKKNLLELAESFWRQVSESQGGKPVWIELRNFIEWTCHHFDLKPPILEGLGDRTEASSSVSLFYPADVAHFARTFASRLKENERAAFYFREAEGLKFAEIAARLGYAGAPGIKYLIEKVLMELKFYLRDLPGLSPEDLNEEAFSLFRDTLLAILKKSIPGP